jgi:hypothetical protein
MTRSWCRRMATDFLLPLASHVLTVKVSTVAAVGVTP